MVYQTASHEIRESNTAMEHSPAAQQSKGDGPRLQGFRLETDWNILKWSYAYSILRYNIAIYMMSWCSFDSFLIFLMLMREKASIDIERFGPGIQGFIHAQHWIWSWSRRQAEQSYHQQQKMLAVWALAGSGRIADEWLCLCSNPMHWASLDKTQTHMISSFTVVVAWWWNDVEWWPMIIYDQYSPL